MCDYFILTKPNNCDVGNDDKNQIISINEKVYILPRNNMTYYIDHGLFEKNLIEWCKQFCKKDKNMLDIGAHSGTYTISLADHCNKIYSFEPQKMTFYSLCGSVALSNIQNVICLNIGLGTTEQAGTQTLNIVSVDGGGSTLHHDNNTNILRTEEIEMRTLDSLNIDNISFIKMDVENNELQVLLSSQHTLKRSNYPKILFEMNQPNAQLLDFLESIQYNVISITGSANMYLAVNKINT
jgi:FkbM family methyltransferase